MSLDEVLFEDDGSTRGDRVIHRYHADALVPGPDATLLDG
jgi:hypothetical protein